MLMTLSDCIRIRIQSSPNMIKMLPKLITDTDAYIVLRI